MRIWRRLFPHGVAGGHPAPLVDQMPADRLYRCSCGKSIDLRQIRRLTP